MAGMFVRCEAFTGGSIGAWDTSNVLTMCEMFSLCRLFVADIGAWDTGNVRTMFGMMYACNKFNADISAWDPHRVETCAKC